ncbi:ATP-binding cassette domain-containing protein [Mesorhizobium atlanticum]
MPLPVVTSETVKLCEEGTWEEMKAGCNAFNPALVSNPGWFRLNLFGTDAGDRLSTPHWSVGQKTDGRPKRRASFSSRRLSMRCRRQGPMTTHTVIPAIEVDSIGKAFGPTVALKDVSFAVRPGSVHALLGENGAGKSTLVKLLSGLMRPNSGRTRDLWRGVPAVVAARGACLRCADSIPGDDADLATSASLTICFCPTHRWARRGLVRRVAARAALRRHVDELGFSVDLDAEVASLELAVRQKIEIARAVYRKPRILLLDEPTSTLAGRDVDWLGAIIARLKAAGTTIVFITHRMR